MVRFDGKHAEPIFKPEPARLNSGARDILEQLRAQYIASHAEYRRDGYDVLGGVSQFDAWMLRAGDRLHIMAVRRNVGERIRKKLDKKYLHAMEIDYAAGGVFVKSGVSQKNASEAKHFSFHPGGITFYGRRGREKSGSLAAAYAIPHQAVIATPAISMPLIRVGVRF